MRKLAARLVLIFLAIVLLVYWLLGAVVVALLGPFGPVPLKQDLAKHWRTVKADSLEFLRMWANPIDAWHPNGR